MTLPDTDGSIDEFARDACEQGAGVRETKTGRTKLFQRAFFKSLGNDREFCTESGKK